MGHTSDKYYTYPEISTVRRNKLRELLSANQPTLGVPVICPWPGIVEIIGHTDVFDYVEFVGEDMPWDLHDLENLSRATELYNMSSMMKVDQSWQEFAAQRALGSGIQNILFTNIRTMKDCVRNVNLDTPEKGGTHGGHARRNVGYHLESASPAYAQAMEDVVIAVMIEKREAMDNLDSILSVEGLDMVQFGPGDLSISFGVPGQTTHPRVKKAELKVIRMAIDMGIRPRVELGFDYSMDDIRRYTDLGVRDFSHALDVQVLHSWWGQHGERLRTVLETA